MALRMKNFNIFRVHWKIRLLGEGSRKINLEGGGLHKKGAWTVCWFKGGLGKKEGSGIFEGGLIPQCTLWVVKNLKKNLFFISEMTRIWWILIWALKSIKTLHFDWFLFCKVYNVWPKKVQRNIFHDTRVMKNLKKNWLVVWKMTWGI